MTLFKTLWLGWMGSLLWVLGAQAATVNFTEATPTATTYQSQGLLLASNTGSFINTFSGGGCGTGSLGCLGNGGSGAFTGTLTLSFVDPLAATPIDMDDISFIMCRTCEFRGGSARVLGAGGAVLQTFNLNTDEGVANRTFSFSGPGIRSLFIDLGSGGDGLESITFAAGSALTVPEPSTLALLALSLAGLAASSRRRPD